MTAGAVTLGAVESSVNVNVDEADVLPALSAAVTTSVGELLVPAPGGDATGVPERPPLGRRLEAAKMRGAARYLVPRPLRARLRRLLGAETRRH